MKFFKFLLVLAVFGSLAFFFWERSSFDFGSNISRVSDFTADVIDDLEREVVAPPPLRRASEEPAAVLTRTGIVRETNKKRRTEGLADLTENTSLDTVAAKKVDDMFSQQYFEHTSPTGKGAGDLAEEAGYAYIMIGENLALGGFKDDVDVVQAWMDSPGHRANIFGERYQEIGVAAKKGLFEGKETWLAVQTFGLPVVACPQPDEALRLKIEINKTELATQQHILEEKRTELDRLKESKDAGYNKEVAVYNELVQAYNALVGETKRAVEVYNETVRVSNACRLGK